MQDLPWMRIAKGYLGLKEAPGAANNPKVVDLYRLSGFAGIKHDSVPWCAALVGGVLARSGIAPSGSLMARSYEQWGSALEAPIYGCVGVMWRGSKSSGQGHVGFVVGANASEIIMISGNHGDAVTIGAFARSRFTAYRYPRGLPPPRVAFPLPSSIAGAKRGLSEA